MANNEETRPYRPCVGILLLNRRNEVFVGKRIDIPGDHWQMPQGGIDEGESPQTAVLRELEEEVGTANAEIIYECPHWFDYDLPPKLSQKAWKGRFRGQTQKWFALRFLGSDAEINILTKHPEFVAWQWVPFDELMTLIVPFKRDVYEQVTEYFRPLLET